MTNPRQRRKARSSAHKPVRHSKRPGKLLKKQPTIRGPRILQESWDKHKTVKQNYAQLGLAHSLAPQPSSTSHAAELSTVAVPPVRGEFAPPTSAVPKGFGRIRRDEHGNIVIVEEGEEREETGYMEDPEDFGLFEERAWGRPTDPGLSNGSTTVVEALERFSHGESKTARFASTGEVEFLRRLVAMYKDDVEAMARDRKLNVQQKTVGQLRRAIQKAGGLEALAL